MQKKNRLSDSPPAPWHLNSVWLEGTVLEDPLDVQNDSGRPLCRFQVASSRYFRQESDTSVFTIEVREPVLTNCRSQLAKGRGVRIIGRLHQDRWKDRAGESHDEVCIISEMVESRPSLAREPAPIS